jgi:uncharacterized repeat protein (TIGR03806 family)
MKKQYLLVLSFVAIVILSISCSKEETYVPIKDVLPVANEDVVTSTINSIVEIQVLSNDTDGDLLLPNSLNIVGGLDTDANGTLDTFTKIGEGTWTTNSNGSITFMPQNGFTGSPTSIKYNGIDLEKNVSNSANVVINSIDLTQVPYPKLSDYKFFVGAIEEQLPTLNVIPYEPASSLFTDYAHKKRFVWMPGNVKATYVADNKTLDFPVGTFLIKTFYYNTIQPNNTTQIIETRVMIRKSDKWHFYEYIWNDSQTDAVLLQSGEFANGSSKKFIFAKPNGEIVNEDYRIPSESECLACHKINVTATNLSGIPIPIGVKPQNLNHNYSYKQGSKNILQELVDRGYLQSYPVINNTTIDYKDITKPLAMRVRSYVDINCAHCHQDQARCDYRPMRFSFNLTDIDSNIGICVNGDEAIGEIQKIIMPGNSSKSILHYRISTNDESERMPLLGRTIVHDEGVALIEEWINSLTQRCN